MNKMDNIIQLHPIGGSAPDRRELELIDLARGGDMESFCKVYDLHKDGLYRYALYRLGSREDAQDAVQECVLAAFRQIGELRRSEAFKGWMYKILSGCCSRIIRTSMRDREKMDKVRQQAAAAGKAGGRTTGSELYGRAEAPAGVNCPQDMTIESITLTQALDQLDQESRDIVLMSVVGGLTSSEVSELIGIRPGSVRSRLSRSLRKMREYLEEPERRASQAEQG